MLLTEKCGKGEGYRVGGLGGEHIDFDSGKSSFEGLKVSAECGVFDFNGEEGADLVVIVVDVNFAGEVVCIDDCLSIPISPRLLRSRSLLLRDLSLSFGCSVLIRLMVRIIRVVVFRLEFIRVGASSFVG
jgi:hypothetical protein